MRRVPSGWGLGASRVAEAQGLRFGLQCAVGCKHAVLAGRKRVQRFCTWVDFGRPPCSDNDFVGLLFAAIVSIMFRYVAN